MICNEGMKSLISYATKVFTYSCTKQTLEKLFKFQQMGPKAFCESCFSGKTRCTRCLGIKKSLHLKRVSLSNKITKKDETKVCVLLHRKNATYYIIKNQDNDQTRYKHVT